MARAKKEQSSNAHRRWDAPSGRDLGEPHDADSHFWLASFIWSICNLLRGPYKRNEYRKVILPLTVLRHFNCLLETITGRTFYNRSELDFPKLLDFRTSPRPKDSPELITACEWQLCTYAHILERRHWRWVRTLCTVCFSIGPRRRTGRMLS